MHILFLLYKPSVFGSKKVSRGRKLMKNQAFVDVIRLLIQSKRMLTG